MRPDSPAAPNDDPLVSVLIPTFNGSRFVRATLESALRQTLSTIEVLVLDDGSTDDTIARVRELDDPRVRIYIHAHSGTPGVLNRGLAEARGRYVALLDHDDLWLPRKLERHVAFFEAHPDAAVTFSWSGLVDEHGRRLPLHSKHWRGPVAFRQLLEDYVVGTSSSLVIRRAALEGAEAFDVQLPRCHDLELLLRLALSHPNGIVAIPAELTLYRRHAGQMSRDWRAMDRDWHTVLDRFRRLAPADTAAVDARARSNISRYLAYVAYEAAEFREARRLVGRAFRQAPRAFISDMRNWKIAAACGCEAVLPTPLHRGLEHLAGIRRD